MHENKSQFKSPPKKYQPRGITVLYEDRDIIVVNKNNGLLTIASDKEKEKTAHYLLNEYVKKGVVRSKNRVYIVHRLDRDTSGVLVFAKDEKAKNFLQEEWSTFDKTYLAVVHGTLEEKEGTVSSYLVENKALKMYSVSDPELGKFAKTGYKVIRESRNFSLLEIKLFTGRKNQIRVHMADIGHPLAGDRSYGAPDKSIKRLALHAASLTIKHPFSKKEMVFETEAPPYLKTILKK